MSDSVLVAIITGVCAIIGAFAGQSVASSRTTANLIAEITKRSDVSDTEIKGEIAVIKAEIVGLRKEVEKHNGVVERMYNLEKDVAKQGEQIKTLFNK